MKNNKYRDCFGKLCYTLKRELDGKVFEVVHGRNEIIENRGDCGRWDALLYNPVFLWESVPEFTSFIQAVSFLKKNIENFL